MNKRFWLSLSILVGFATYLAYIAFAPSLNFSQGLDRLRLSQRSNEFVVYKGEALAQLLPGVSQYDLIGLCYFDVEKGFVRMHVNMPNRFWKVTIFASNGVEIYALNSFASPQSDFKIDVHSKSSYFGLMGGADDDKLARPIEELPFIAESPEATGLAVFWIPFSNIENAEALRSVFAQNKCEVISK